MNRTTANDTVGEEQSFTHITHIVNSASATASLTVKTTVKMNTTGDSPDNIISTLEKALHDNFTSKGGESGASIDFYGLNYYDDFVAYDYDYNILLYPGFKFERLIYMIVWEILVIITCLVNILVITILLRKSMRTPTNVILTAIAISDSLTGLVTLPGYIMVYRNFDPCITNQDQRNTSLYANETVIATLYKSVENSTDMFDWGSGNFECKDGYVLTKDICRFFMISKFFVSKTFNTMSKWLTVFLAVQRYISVAFPFKYQALLTMKKTVISCSIVAMLAILLHLYHLLDEKADPDGGMCGWVFDENCDSACAQLSISFFLRHVIPCLLLILFTILFIRELTSSSNKAIELQGHVDQIYFKKRQDENQRISIMVTTIVVVFLIPEVPYASYLLSSAIKHMGDVKPDLEQYRAVHAAYEISLVFSFHANFYIYTFLNKRFRTGLRTTIRHVTSHVTSMLGMRRA